MSGMDIQEKRLRAIEVRENTLLQLVERRMELISELDRKRDVIDKATASLLQVQQEMHYHKIRYGIAYKKKAEIESNHASCHRMHSKTHTAVLVEIERTKLAKVCAKHQHGYWNSKGRHRILANQTTHEKEAFDAVLAKLKMVEKGEDVYRQQLQIFKATSKRSIDNLFRLEQKLESVMSEEEKAIELLNRVKAEYNEAKVRHLRLIEERLNIDEAAEKRCQAKSEYKAAKMHHLQLIEERIGIHAERGRSRQEIDSWLQYECNPTTALLESTKIEIENNLPPLVLLSTRPVHPTSSAPCDVPRGGSPSRGDGEPHKWHSNFDISYRREMIQHVTKLLEVHRNYSQEYKSKVPQIAEQLELSLYKAAGSFGEYMDMSTLKQRLQRIASEISARTREGGINGVSADSPVITDKVQGDPTTESFRENRLPFKKRKYSNSTPPLK